jgi:hypothetical protein
MMNGGERLDRIEAILEEVTEATKRVTRVQEEMAARQQYHDEAFERQDTEIKALREALVIDAENIRGLVRIAELHHERLERLEGGEPT